MNVTQTQKCVGRWYLCPTKRGKETLAGSALKAVSLEVFLPLIYERPEHKPEPLFPHYIFVRLDSPDRLRAVRCVNGMRDDVVAQRSTVEIPEFVVESLKIALEERARGLESELPSEAVRALIDRRLPSLERTVRLLKIVSQH